MEFQCRVIVQRRCTSCCSSVENIPLQAERHSARRQKLFAFPPELAFTFRPECCSESQRNRVRLHSGIAFTFDRIPHLQAIRATDLWALPLLTLRVRHTCDHENPSRRSSATRSASTLAGGLPNFLPLARALRRPARTLSRMRSRSSCATADTIVKSACPRGEVVSIFSW